MRELGLRGGLPVRASVVLAIAVIAMLALPAGAGAGHGLLLLDHPAPAFQPASAPSSTMNSGGDGAEWELLDTIDDHGLRRRHG